MPIQTEKIANLPAVIATYTGYIVSADVEKMYQDSGSLLADVGDVYYRINDVRKSETSFADFLEISSLLKTEGKFRTSDPNLISIFVGTNIWIYNYRNIGHRFGIEFPTFNGLRDAIAFIQEDILARTGNLS